MFKLLFSAITGGGPAEWAILALGIVLALGGSFAGGALWESGHVATLQAKVLTDAKAIAAKDQHDADVKAIADAKKVSDDAVAAKADSDAKYALLAKSLHALPRVTVGAPPANNPTLCDLSPDALTILNKAGH